MVVVMRYFLFDRIFRLVLARLKNLLNYNTTPEGVSTTTQAILARSLKDAEYYLSEAIKFYGDFALFARFLFLR